MSVSLRDVVLAVGYGDASLVGESAGYLILGAADHALRDCQRACVDSITIDEEGSVRLKGAQVDEDEAERALRALLASLLARVRIPSNNLARVAKRRELRGLRGLVEELEAALVPVNRRAARRTLARLCREAHKSAARQHTSAEVAPVLFPREPAASIPPEADPSFQEPSPLPEAVQLAPSPAFVAAEPIRQGGRVEHGITVPARRVSQFPTVPARPHPGLLERFAETYAARTPVSSTQVGAEDPSSLPPTPVVDTSHDLLDEELEAEEADHLDEMETQLFAAVAPIAEPASPTQNAIPSASTFAPRRRHVASERSRRVVSDEDSLIVMSASAPQRTASDITDLLDKMSVLPTSAEELYTGLKSLSRIDLSPMAPQVGAALVDDDRR